MADCVQLSPFLTLVLSFIKNLFTFVLYFYDKCCYIFLLSLQSTEERKGSFDKTVHVYINVNFIFFQSHSH